jgi:hypothetical protein
MLKDPYRYWRSNTLSEVGNDRLNTTSERSQKWGDYNTSKGMAAERRRVSEWTSVYAGYSMQTQALRHESPVNKPTAA